MALLKCKQCSGQVSSDAKACPHCGSASFKPSKLPIFIFIFVVLIVIWNLNSKDSTHSTSDSTAPASQPGETKSETTDDASVLKEKLLTQNGGVKKYWKKVEFEIDSDTDFDFTITYKKSFKDYDLAKLETEKLARTTLKYLVKNGRKPNDDMILINVTAFQDAGTGETGQPLIINLGTSRYDYNSDQIKFESN
jgi:hypothetical protein